MSNYLNFNSVYYPFGSIMPGRGNNPDSYRYGFNGMEEDNTLKGPGNSYDFGARLYDSRLGKFLSTDPFRHYFPHLSPYQFAANMPIWAIDLDGKEAWITTKEWTINDLFEFQQWVKAELQRLNDITIADENGARAKETSFSCDDLPIAMLIKFASERGLPIYLHANRDDNNKEKRFKYGQVISNDNATWIDPNDPEAVNKFAETIRRYTDNASMDKFDLIKISPNEAMPGDVTNKPPPDGGTFWHMELVIDNSGDLLNVAYGSYNSSDTYWYGTRYTELMHRNFFLANKKDILFRFKFLDSPKIDKVEPISPHKIDIYPKVESVEPSNPISIE